MGSRVITTGLHTGQAEVLRSPHRFKIVVAGRRWGKTALAREMCISKARVPNKKVWYIAPSYRMAKQIMWQSMKDAVPKAWVKKINENELAIHLKNRSVIECKGADDPDSLRGVEVFFACHDEFQDMRPEVWKEAIRPTLAKDRGHAMFIGTPKGYNNLYDVFSRGQDPQFKQWMSWQFETITSPFIPREEIRQAMSDMDPRTFRQEFMASFETMSGRVYHTFDRRLHVGNYPFNPNLPIWVGQDFNVDPMSTSIMQPQPNGELWLVDEIFLRNSNSLEVCDELERRYYRYQKQVTIYPDPAGGNRSSSRGESDLDIFRARGFKKIKFRKKHPPVADRTNSVNKKLKAANGDITMRINVKCRESIQSLEQTQYKENSRDVDKTAGAEHMADAIGYPIELEYPARKLVIAGYSL